MIGHLVLWRYWMESRQRNEWAREVETLRSMEPAVMSFRHDEATPFRKFRVVAQPAIAESAALATHH